ncbi:hypothetical protein CCR75_004793 [Bremia lactucae]|uniref:Auto-transporter adhesin head GIN domain-containing protein n=1 Tax=Bremia lactucae TaxID=4779 RepID=A0A976FGQ1_BRELC|nr:hypothetical protein CCR75_004793 [Bremia lactucae]
MNLAATLLFAACTAATVNARFTVTSGTTETNTNSSMNSADYVRQWTINSAASGDAVNSIDLNLAGRVYVTHMSNMPTGVLGYVRVSGDSEEVVNAVEVSNDDAADQDNDSNDNDGELSVMISTAASSSLSGYLLTEVLLASSGIVSDIKSQRSADVVVLESVLLTDNTNAELQVEASGSSAVYVSAGTAEVSVRQLQLSAKNTARLQFNVQSVTATEDVTADVEDSATLSLLSSSVMATTLEFQAQGTGTVCLSASTVTGTPNDFEGSGQISLPNAEDKHSTTGTGSCEEVTIPSREPACVSNDCPGASPSNTPSSSNPSTIASDDTPAAQEGVSTNVEASSSPARSLAALAAAVIAVASAVLI